MDTLSVVNSQCAACDEQTLFLDPEKCARCLSGYEPVEIEEEKDEPLHADLCLNA